MSTETHVQIDRARLRRLIDRERATFAERHPRSRELFADTSKTLLGGVPMSWMTMWAGGFPLFFAEASGARVTDVDGHTFVDFCLGDTGAMAGHAPEPTAQAVERQVRRGTTVMLPDEDAAWVGEELVRRFGMDAWQFSLTATDANRWVLRMARALTDRPKVLVFNYCYHGTVDETVISIEDGVPQARPGNVGPAVDPTVTTKVVEFNDVEALREALAPGDVAAVLAEPALTNIGIVLPDAGFHDALRQVTRETGTLLIIDETHTFSSGPGGYTAAHGLDPDILTIGKSIAGGVPIGAYGLRRELADRILELDVDLEDVGGVGGTLAGNALSLAAARATLGEVLTDEAFARMIRLAERYTAGVEEVLASRRMPWNIVQLGARAEYRFTPRPPRNGGESAAAHDGELDAYMHVYLMNREVLITPFHNMALMCPATVEADVDRHTEVFAAAVDELIGGDG
ncbi:MAG TPA: aspartate aminotransferase family protein [Gaiellales bacterium]|nr:aspartate aminotransferase family protein [Gaiellales bacterium]